MMKSMNFRWNSCDTKQPAATFHLFIFQPNVLHDTNHSSLPVYRILTRIMWPVEMSMLAGTGSSHQEEVLLRADGLPMGPSLNCDDTLLRREWRRVSGRSTRSDVLIAIRWRHSSWGNHKTVWSRWCFFCFSPLQSKLLWILSFCQTQNNCLCFLSVHLL